MFRKSKRILCVLMSLILLFSTTLMVSAENQVQPRWSYTNFTFVGLEVTTAGTAYCTANVDGYDGITTKVHIEMKLQKYTVLWWSTQETWEGTFNDYYGTLVKTKSVGSGTYRVKAVFTVYSGSASEEITSYSQEKKITVS